MRLMTLLTKWSQMERLYHLQSRWKTRRCDIGQLDSQFAAVIIQEKPILFRTVFLFVFGTIVARLASESYACANTDRDRDGYNDSDHDGPD